MVLTVTLGVNGVSRRNGRIKWLVELPVVELSSADCIIIVMSVHVQFHINQKDSTRKVNILGTWSFVHSKSPYLVNWQFTLLYIANLQGKIEKKGLTSTASPKLSEEHM